MRITAYLRVSTDQQADNGSGLDVQRAAITAWAKSNGHKIVATYSDEGISGSNGLDTRAGLTAAFRDLEDGKADALVVYRLDRLARKLANQETWIERLERKGCSVISVTEPEYGDDEMRAFVRQVLGAVAEYERAVIVKRMQSGRAMKASKGGYAGYGSPAYGQRADAGELVTNDAEAPVVAMIMAMHHDGLSLRQIASALNQDGVPAKRGGAWSAKTVSRVVGRAG